MVEIVKTTLFAGMKHGLVGATAVSHWRIPARVAVALTQQEIEQLQEKCHRLWMADPLHGVAQQDWPASFLNESQPASLCHWAVALTVALLRHARDPAYIGCVVSFQNQDVRVALPYARQALLMPAMRFAWAFLDLWLNREAAPQRELALITQFSKWLDLVQPKGLAPNTLRFALAAFRLGVPVSWSVGMLRLGWGEHVELMDSSFTGRTSTLATRCARNKPLASSMLRQAAVPVPVQRVVSSVEQALEFVAKVGWPVVVKPSNQDQGLGVVPAIHDEAVFKKAFDAAAVYSPRAVIVEQHVVGHDHRMLVVGGKLLMATLRVPGGVVGDGAKSITELVNGINADPRRGSGKRSLMIRLVLDEEAIDCLRVQGLTPDSVPKAGCLVALRKTANISTGGTAVDVTSVVHPDNVVVAERAARALGLDIAGVDFLCPDISRSWREVGGAVCEVNAQPGFRPHWLSDPDRDVNAEIVQWMFREKPARIPTAAIAGTNGKTTVARMLHCIWSEAGKVAGVCTTQGVWVGRELVTDKNLSGHPGARLILEDPTVQAAVIELPRKGLIKFGHPCDRYDVAALLNIQDDHIGVDGIETMQQMAELKAEVVEMATEAVVLNAEDALCMSVRERAGTKRVVLVASDRASPELSAHLAAGQEAVFVATHQGVSWVVWACGVEQSLVMPVAEISSVMAGLLRVNVSNALFAIALAHVQGLPWATIRRALQRFGNAPSDNPGRYNFIDGLPFKVLLDYGHNPDGVKELCRVVQELHVEGKRRLLNLKIGNRHKSHLLDVAATLTQTFDSFVLGCDAAYVGRSSDYAGADPPASMLTASKLALLNAGAAEGDIRIEQDYRNAIRLALAGARQGDFLVLLAEPWEALPILKEQLALLKE